MLVVTDVTVMVCGAREIVVGTRLVEVTVIVEGIGGGVEGQLNMVVVKLVKAVVVKIEVLLTTEVTTLVMISVVVFMIVEV